LWRLPVIPLSCSIFDLGRLPEHVKAALYSEATTFSAPQLQTSGNIAADSATSVSAPQLQASARIEAPTRSTIGQRIRHALQL
jgi:hypothetical protein